MDCKIIISLQPELHGGHAEMFLDILAEEGRIRETKQVANLLDTVVGLLQIETDVL